MTSRFAVHVIVMSAQVKLYLRLPAPSVDGWEIRQSKLKGGREKDLDSCTLENDGR